MSGRRRALGLALVVAALAAASGCGSSGAASSSTTVPSETDAAAARLAGRYAHYDVVAYEGNGMKTLIISYGFTDLTDEGGTLVAHESFCSSEHRSDQPIQVHLSDAATQAIKPVPTEVTLTVEDGKARISRPATPTGIGVTLADPAHDPLPTDPKDPRVNDADGDGKPGITATIKVSDALTGEIYIARREIFAYDVSEQADGSLTGTVSDHSEQLVIGASNDMFLTQAQWTQHPDLTKSPIILIPVDASWDCEKLMAERPQLFPPTPTVDY